MDRRDFIRKAGAAALLTGVGGLSAACGTGAGASGSGGKRSVRLGFIALTDCAPIVMAKELGYFDELDLDVSVEKQTSWPATLDALLNGQIDGAHALFSLPLSVAAKIGGKGSTALKIALVLNQNGQAITLNQKRFAGVGYADLAKAKAAIEAGKTTMAMTFPGGTHDTWLRYWLKATKVDPKATKIIPIPPPQMVANMKVGTMDGFCVGEPWNAVAVKQGVGFTHIATQDLFAGHPEKALVVGEKFANERQDVLKDVMAAVLKAAKWLDDLENRAKAVDTLAKPKYINTPAAGIKGRLLGEYDLGAGLGSKKYDAASNMRFFADGAVNSPSRGHALWFLAQYHRFGLVDKIDDPHAIVDKVLLRDLYKEVAADAKLDVPDDMAPFDVALDATRFNPAEFAKEAARL